MDGERVGVRGPFFSCPALQGEEKRPLTWKINDLAKRMAKSLIFLPLPEGERADNEGRQARGQTKQLALLRAVSLANGGDGRAHPPLPFQQIVAQADQQAVGGGGRRSRPQPLGDGQFGHIGIERAQ